jgi:hypothetical protein
VNVKLLFHYHIHKHTNQAYKDSGGCLHFIRRCKYCRWHTHFRSRGSSVSIVTRLHSGRLCFYFGKEWGILSLRHYVQTGSAAHLASYRMRTGGSSPEGKAPLVWTWTPKERDRDTHWIGGWVGPTIGLNAMVQFVAQSLEWPSYHAIKLMG